VKSSDATFFPESSTVSERAYVMAAYRIKSWLQPSVYYSMLYPDVNKRGGREDVQHDFAATLRFDINAYWLVKLEGHYMRGTAGLTPAPLNENKPLGVLAQEWGVFLVKTTAHF
jgi:hypothetical protein